MKRTTIICASLLVLAAAGGCKKKEPAKAAAGSGSATAGGSGAGSGAATGSAGSGEALGSAGGAAGSVGSAAAPAPALADKRVIIKDAGFMTPESVLYDAGGDAYLVANINGSPAEADDNGFISRLTPDGKVAELKWIDGTRPDVKLDAPKGMAISGDVLWVADITVVRKFDAKTGAPKGEVKVPKSTFLNDVAPADGGGIYVSDTGFDAKFAPTGADAVYHITGDGKVKPLIKSKDLGHPNGLAVANGSVWVVTFGSGELYEVNLKGEKTAGVKLPKGQLDGFVVGKDGEMFVSSWEAKAVYAAKSAADWKVILGDVQAPADLGWDSKRNVLLVPQFLDNAVVLLPL